MLDPQALEDGLIAQRLEHKLCFREQLLQYVALLDKWNRVYNLTAVRDPTQMIHRHILDSLTLLPFIAEAETLADIGSGGGLPGIPLAICEPEKAFTLIDSNVKKTRFLTHAVHTLGINNIHVVHDRVENYYPEACFDGIISRAFATPSVILDKAAHLCNLGGKILLMVAKLEQLDISGNTAFSAGKTYPVDVYNETASRHIVIFEKNRVR